MRVATFALASALAWAPFVAAQDLGREPPRGSAERKAILDTVRPVPELRLGLPVEFVVFRLATHGDWTFFQGEMQRPGGVPLRCADIRFPGDCDMMDGFSIVALLAREGARWRLVEADIGPTDVSWVAWPEIYPVPCRLVFDRDYCEGQGLR